MDFVGETRGAWSAKSPKTATQTYKKNANSIANCEFDIGDVVDWLRTIAETSAPAVTRVATLLAKFVQTRTLSGSVSPRVGGDHLNIEPKKFTARLTLLETRGLISRSGSAYCLVRQSVEARARACGAGRRTGKLTAARVRSQGAPFTVLAARAAAAIPNRSRSLASWRFQWATTAIIESRGGRLEIRLILAVEAGTRVIDDAGNVGFVTRIADLAREFGTSVREVRKALASLEQKSWVVTTRYDRVGLTGTDAVTIVPIRPDRLAVLVEDPVTIEAATMLMDRIADRINRAPRPVKPGTPYSIDLVIDSSSLRSEARKGALGRRIQDDPEKTNRSTHNPSAGWAARFAQRLEALGGSGKAVRQGGQSGARLSDLQATAVTDLLGCCVAAVNSPIITVSDGTRRSICDAFQRHERHLASGRAATWRLRHPTKSIAQWIAQDVANDPAIAALLAEASGRGDHTAAELDAAISIAAPFVVTARLTAVEALDRALEVGAAAYSGIDCDNTWRATGGLAPMRTIDAVTIFRALPAVQSEHVVHVQAAASAILFADLDETAWRLPISDRQDMVAALTFAALERLQVEAIAVAGLAAHELPQPHRHEVTDRVRTVLLARRNGIAARVSENVLARLPDQTRSAIVFDISAALEYFAGTIDLIVRRTEQLTDPATGIVVKIGNFAVTGMIIEGAGLGDGTSADTIVLAAAAVRPRDIVDLGLEGALSEAVNTVHWQRLETFRSPNSYSVRADRPVWWSDVIERELRRSVSEAVGNATNRAATIEERVLDEAARLTLGLWRLDPDARLERIADMVREFGAADRGVLLGFADLISQLRDSDGHHPQALGQRRRQPFQLIEQGDAAE